MINNLACRLTVNLGSFKVSLGNPWFWAGVIFALVLLWRWWGIKKLLSFALIIFILMFLMFKLDSLIVRHLKEQGEIYTYLTKPFFIGLSAFVFLYYGFIQREK